MPDDGKTWVSLSSSVLAVAGAIYATIAAQKSVRVTAALQAEREERADQRQADRTMAKFRDPLMHAAYDLQGRLFNILQKAFLERYLIGGTTREQEYAIENTVFLIAQFLGWTEAIRQGLQFLDLGESTGTREFRHLQDTIYSHLQRDDIASGFRLFAGEQRAIGELMIVRAEGEWRCIGFAEFTSSRNAPLDQWLNPLREDLREVRASDKSGPRLRLLQHALIDLLLFLDHTGERFPWSKRAKA